MQLRYVPLIRSLEALEQEIGGLNRQMKARTAADPVCRRLMTIPGALALSPP